MKNPLAYDPSEEFKEGKCAFSKGINENVIIDLASTENTCGRNPENIKNFRKRLLKKMLTAKATTLT